MSINLVVDYLGDCYERFFVETVLKPIFEFMSIF